MSPQCNCRLDLHGTQALERGHHAFAARFEGEHDMPRNNFADSADLAMLAKAVDDHCAEYGIVDAKERENIAARLVHLFQDGTIAQRHRHSSGR